jgi:cellulose synthase operon protein C
MSGMNHPARLPSVTASEKQSLSCSGGKSPRPNRRPRSWGFVGALALLAMAVQTLPGCVGGKRPAESPVESLRRDASASADSKLVERWLAAELLEPKGQPKEAKRARERLLQLGGPITARGELALALDDHFHGRLKTAPDRYLRAVEKARLDNQDPEAETIAWTAVRYAMDLKRSDPKLWEHWKDWVTRALSEPMHIGWRARGELADWSVNETIREGSAAAEESVNERLAREFGCVSELRLAGPFGHGANRDLYRSFPAELPGPWPQRWPAELGIEIPPSVLVAERNGCLFNSKEPVDDGVFYVETYVDLPVARDLVIAVQGVRSLLIDDYPVLTRDTRIFGVWPKFGVRVRLEAGRHRVLGRLTSAVTSIRIVDPSGRPAGVATSTDAGAPYAIKKPELGPDPNVLVSFVDRGKVKEPSEPLLRFAAASLAEEEGQSDVASVLIEPLITDTEHATGTSLLLAARFAEQDPLFQESQMRDIVRALHEKAEAHDPGLWEPALALALFKAEQAGAKEAVATIEKLSNAHPEVPGVIGSLVRLYRQLGWEPEYQAAVARMLGFFPSDPAALAAGVELFDARGKWDEADDLVRRIRELDGDNEIALNRALAREDWKEAIAELERLRRRRPDRKDIIERISDVMERGGDVEQAYRQLASVLAKRPKDAGVRRSIADHELARGQKDALRRAIIDAVQAGAETDALEEALDLTEGMTDLEPFRMQAEPLIAAFEQSGRELPGTAARVLDYAAFWIRADASSYMLEHEIVHIQSAEAIREFAEYHPPQGRILHLRVIKPDGRTFEPEIVPSKPSVTFPHIEIGDYIETEVIVRYNGDGQHGHTYLGHSWFFREEKLAYDRSELVIVSPANRPLTVESRANAPEPRVEKRDGLVIYRWRVDGSPAASSEPYRPSAREVMPNVRVGWGADFSLRLREFLDLTAVATPVDPRIKKIAQRLVEGAPNRRLEKARRLYHFVVENVENGEEMDGRRIITGRTGNRWRGLVELCRALDIPYAFGVAKNRLQPPPAGPFDKMNEYGELVLRVGKPPETAELTIGEKFTPFGYLPPEIRGAEVYMLDSDPPKLGRLSQGVTTDVFNTALTGRLERDGSATLEISQIFTGKVAIVLRNIIATAPEGQLRSFVEGKLIAPALQGARLIKFDFGPREKSDEPLVLKTRVEVPRFAEKIGNALVFSAPFTPRLQALGALATRETPMILDDSSDQSLAVELELPTGASVKGLSAERHFTSEDRDVSIKDRLEKGKLVLERRTKIPAGRVPLEEYPKFATFTRDAGAALAAEIRVELK